VKPLSSDTFSNAKVLLGNPEAQHSIWLTLLRGGWTGFI
jgi:hypothetical protein